MEGKTGEITTIKLDRETKSRLDKLKEHDKESYNEVIKKTLYLLNILRKNPLYGNKLLANIDKTIKRKEVYRRILNSKPLPKNQQSNQQVKKEVPNKMIKINKPENQNGRDNR